MESLSPTVEEDLGLVRPFLTPTNSSSNPPPTQLVKADSSEFSVNKDVNYAVDEPLIINAGSSVSRHSRPEDAVLLVPGHILEEGEYDDIIRKNSGQKLADKNGQAESRAEPERSGSFKFSLRNLFTIRSNSQMADEVPVGVTGGANSLPGSIPSINQGLATVPEDTIPVVPAVQRVAPASTTASAPATAPGPVIPMKGDGANLNTAAFTSNNIHYFNERSTFHTPLRVLSFSFSVPSVLQSKTPSNSYRSM
jgi:hypothetical protein